MIVGGVSNDTRLLVEWSVQKAYQVKDPENEVPTACPRASLPAVGTVYLPFSATVTNLDTRTTGLANTGIATVAPDADGVSEPRWIEFGKSRPSGDTGGLSYLMSSDCLPRAVTKPTFSGSLGEPVPNTRLQTRVVLNGGETSTRMEAVLVLNSSKTATAFGLLLDDQFVQFGTLPPATN